MEPEVRPARPSEMEEFMAVARLGFGFPSDFKVSLDAEWTMCAFIDGHLATSYAAWPLEMYLGGRTIPVAGITWVSTHPVFRRRNCLRKVTAAHFRRLYEFKGPAVTALQASMAAIYQRYGYGVVSTRYTYSVEPQDIRFSTRLPLTGSLREAADKDIPVMADIYNRFAQDKVGLLKRNSTMETAPGSFTVLYTPPAAVPVKLIYSEQGKDLGYIIYHIVRDTGGGNPLGQRINVADIAYLSPSAYQAIWSCLANLDIAVRVDWNKVPEDDPLPHLLQEPRKLNTTSVDGLLARIVDVERAMLQRGYAADGEMSFEVIDELCPWNNACWQLAIRNGEVEIERRRRKFQLRMPVSTLALLYFGQLSATQAALMGRLEAADAESLEQWDRALYYKFKPACSDTF